MDCCVHFFEESKTNFPRSHWCILDIILQNLVVVKGQVFYAAAHFFPDLLSILTQVNEAAVSDGAAATEAIQMLSDIQTLKHLKVELAAVTNLTICTRSSNSLSIHTCPIRLLFVGILGVS